MTGTDDSARAASPTGDREALARREVDRRTVLRLLYVAAFLQSMAYGATFLLPIAFARNGGDESDVGAVLGVVFVTLLVAVLGSGHLSDRFGRMRVLAIAGAVLAAATAALAQAPPGSVLAYAAGALFGASWGQFYAHTPIVLAALVNGPARTRAFLEFNSYALLGVAVTPLLARALAPVGGDEVTAMQVAAGASLLAAACIAVMGRRMVAAGLAVGSGVRAGLSLAGIRAVAGSSAVWVVLMIGMGAVAFSGMHAFQTSFALKNGLDFSVFFIAYTLTVVAARLIFAGWLSRLSPYPAIATFLALMCAAEVLFVAVAGQPLLYALAAVLFALGYGLTYPMLTAVAADEAPDGARDQCLLLVTFAYYVGGFGFPFIAGWIVVTAGYNALLWTLAAIGAAQCAMALWRWRAARR